MFNVHSPERQPGESYEDFKRRRKVSHILTKRNNKIGSGGTASRQQRRSKRVANLGVE